MVPVRRHLRKHPGDYPGAQAILLKFIPGVPVSVEDPLFAATRANAGAMIRDEPNVPVFQLRRTDLHGVDLTVGVGSKPHREPIRIAVWRLSRWTGTPVIRVKADHEFSMSEPAVLTRDRPARAAVRILHLNTSRLRAFGAGLTEQFEADCSCTGVDPGRRLGHGIDTTTSGLHY